SSSALRKRDGMQTMIHILESVQLKWEHFQTWTEFSRLHLSNKLAIFGVGYNRRWRDDVRYHHAEISSQCPWGRGARVLQPGKAGGPRHHDQSAEDELEERLLQIPGHHHQRGALPGTSHGGGLDLRRPVRTGRVRRRNVALPPAHRHSQDLRALRHRLRGPELGSRGARLPPA
ncbi:unnamed protein product, partial [Tetraodon nigroviridis]